MTLHKIQSPLVYGQLKPYVISRYLVPVGLDERARELVVDHKHRSYNTIWLHCGVCDSPVVLARDTCVRDLAWVVRVGVVCAPVSPWPKASTWLRAIKVTIESSAVKRSKRAVA